MLTEFPNCLIDLHLHLDGSLSTDTVRALAEMQGIAIPEEEEILNAMLRVSDGCRDLNEYLTKFDFPLSLLQTKGAISEAVYRLKEELRAEGLIYAEIRFAPQLHLLQGLSQREVVEAALEGSRQSSLPSGLILCCMRLADRSKENCETVRLAAEYRDRGVCLLDLAGAEALFPNECFVEEFALARSFSMPFTLHAGEARGAESVESAIRMGASRIGHGVRSLEDDAVVRLLAERKIPLELCPTSNLNTAVFDDIHAYPIREFLRRGVPVTVNTDNRTVSSTTIHHEWSMLLEAFDFTRDEVYTILRSSANAAFVSDDLRQELLKKIDAWYRREV